MQKFLFFALFFPLFIFAQDAFSPFTGRVIEEKVCVYVAPTVESGVVQKLHQDDILLVVGEKQGFWAVAPKKECRCYVYRTYIVDKVVESNRVNVYFEPSLNAPILGVLHMGEKVEGRIDPQHTKWYEIAVPSNFSFYVPKKQVSYLGKANLFPQFNAKKMRADQHLFSAYTQLEDSVKGPIKEPLRQKLLVLFDNFLQEYPEFPQLQEKARYGKSLLLQHTLKEDPCAKNLSVVEEKAAIGMQNWHAIEERLFQLWQKKHPGLNRHVYEETQKLHATWYEGKIEKYGAALKNKPGDFLLKKDRHCIGFLYSIAQDLSSYQGKPVRLLLSPRPNNYYAFEAYCVLAVE